VAFPLQQRMRLHLDVDENVSRRSTAEPGFALPAQPDLLPVLDAGRHLHIEHLAVGQEDPPCGAACRIDERNGQVRRKVTTGGANDGFAEVGPPEQLGKQVLGAEPAASRSEPATACARSERPAAGPAAGATAPDERSELLEYRIAVSVDLAAVVGRALLLVLQEVVRGRNLGELALRVLVILVGIRMQLLRQPAI